MNQAKYDTIIIGGGIVGASALFALASRSHTKTLLLEKNKHFGRGTTGAWGSLIRVYHANARTTELASLCMPYFLNFEEITGKPAGYTQTGSLYFLPKKDRTTAEKRLSGLNLGSLKASFLTAQEGKKHFPDFQWVEEDIALYEPYAGFACPWQTTESWIEAAVDLGAEALTDQTVVDFEIEARKIVAIKTAKTRYLADQFVLATGIWSPQLLDLVGESHPILLRAIQIAQLKRTRGSTRLPFFIDLPNRSFGRPAPDGSFLGGHLQEKWEASPEALQPLNLQEAHLAKQRLAMRLPWIKNATLQGGIRAVEAYTPNQEGFFHRSEKFSNLLVAAGWSCTGFTLAPIIGENIAENILGQKPTEKISYSRCRAQGTRSRNQSSHA